MSETNEDKGKETGPEQIVIEMNPEQIKAQRKKEREQLENLQKEAEKYIENVVNEGGGIKGHVPFLLLLPQYINLGFSALFVILSIVAFTTSMDCLIGVVIAIFVLYIIDILITATNFYIIQHPLKPGMLEKDKKLKKLNKYLLVLYFALWIYALVELIICDTAEELAWVVVLIYVIGDILKIVISIILVIIIAKKYKKSYF